MKDISKMTLREVKEFSRNIPIDKGGLTMFFNKLVEVIEGMQLDIEGIERDLKDE